MSDWTPITVGKPRIRGLRGDRLELVFPLSDTGPPAWRIHLSDSLATVASGGTGVPRPELRSTEIVIYSLEGEEELKSWIERVAGEVESANAFYIDIALPEAQAFIDATNAAGEDKERRLQVAREQVERLTDED